MTGPAPTRDSLAGKLPVTLITGFLGSGKTTLLKRLLRDPGMNRAAVIINEFGEVGIDHELVASSSESMTLLSNGCLCCTVRTDLQETLRELFIKRRAGEVIDFDRVFVETTGLADPVPVLHTLQTDGMLGAQYRLDCVVTLIDAVNGLQNLDDMPEAAKQAAVADRIVITKSDIARPGAVAALEARLEHMNPYAARAVAVNGEVEVAFLRDVGPRSTRLPRGARTRGGARRGDPLVLPAVRETLHLGHVLGRRAGADLAARTRPAARQRPGQRHGRTRSGGRAGRPARVSPSGHARCMVGRRPALAHRVHHAQSIARVCRSALRRRGNARHPAQLTVGDAPSIARPARGEL